MPCSFLRPHGFVRHGILQAFPIWLLGAALFKLKPPPIPPHKARYLRIAASVIYLPIFFVLARLHSLQGLYRDYFLGVLTFALLWVMLSAKEAHDPAELRVRTSRELARFSYTLYAVHVPFLVFLLSLLAGETRWVPTPGKIAIGAAVLLCALIYAYGLAFLTEFRTDAIRTRLERILHISSAPHGLSSNPSSHPANPLSISERDVTTR